MADFTLRPATEADFPAIRRLIADVHINPTGLHWRRFLIAVAPSGELLGCGQIKRHGDGSRELASIAVRPGFRGRGIARAVIETLLANQAPPLYLMCLSEMGPLYSKFGFRELNRAQMPPYFRRIAALVGPLDALAGGGSYLMVMKWD